MKICLDAMGGDFGPTRTIPGAKEALARYSDISHLYLVGRRANIEEEMHRCGLTDPRAEVVEASQIITMDDPSTAALRPKKDSSISVAMDMVRSRAAHAVVSAGHTGASVATATVRLGRLKGIDRPGIASPIPNEHGMCYIVDAGANPSAKPIHLYHYAIMGTIYTRQMHGKERPVVGIMSVGEEDEKGTDLTLETFSMLQRTDLNFKGNVEGHDLFETELDVVVCDGFVGNVMLKSCEATAKAMFKWIRAEIERSGPLVKLAASIARPAFRAVRERGNYETYGGSPLLGVRGTVIIGHGSSTSLAVTNAIGAARDAVRHGVNPLIETEIERLANLTGNRR